MSDSSTSTPQDSQLAVSSRTIGKWLVSSLCRVSHTSSAEEGSSCSPWLQISLRKLMRQMMFLLFCWPGSHLLAAILADLILKKVYSSLSAEESLTNSIFSVRPGNFRTRSINDFVRRRHVALTRSSSFLRPSPRFSLIGVAIQKSKARLLVSGWTPTKLSKAP